MAVRGRGASGWTVSEDDDRTKGGGCIAATDPSVRLNCERCSSRREAMSAQTLIDASTGAESGSPITEGMRTV